MKQMSEEQIEARKKIIKAELKSHELTIQQAEHKILRADVCISTLKKELMDLDFNSPEKEITIEAPKRRQRKIIEQKEIREVFEDRLEFYDGSERLRPRLAGEEVKETAGEELEPSPSYVEENSIV